MSVLLLKNIVHEGPGTIEDFLRENAIDYRIVEMSSEDIPASYDADTLVIMGGPMSVNEGGMYPYLAKEEDLIRDFLKSGKRVLGICLGAQLMAKALGAKVYPGPEKEIGWYDIELVNGGESDPRIRKLAVQTGSEAVTKTFKVFHWHGETFDIPAGAQRIARSALYENQAFLLGDNAYAFQFHIEVTKEMIYDWLRNEPVDMEEIRRDTESWYPEYVERAFNFYKAFFLENTGRNEGK